MTDIVERLRKLRYAACEEAADKIERLQDELHYCKGTCDLAMRHRNDAEAQVDRLQAALSWIADQDPQLVDAAREKFKLPEEAKF